MASPQILAGMPRSCRRLLLPLFLLQLVPFLTIAHYRLIDGDEGFYLMAARIVYQHKTPYHDFFFTQTPLMPYAYGLWMQIAGYSWLSARMFSGGLAALFGTILFAYVSSETRRSIAGLVAVLLFLSSTLVFGWFTTAKTYALSAVFLIFAFTMVRSRAVRAVVFSGFCLGLAADVRLYLAGLIPLFLWWLYREAKPGSSLKPTVSFLVGFAVAVVPNLYFFLRDPRAYLFDNLLFHSIRSSSGIIGNFPQKLYVLAQLCFTNIAGNGLQMTILLAVLIWQSVSWGIKGPGSRRALQLSASLAVISLLPTPSYIQYFCLCVPFMILGAVCTGSALLDSMKALRTRRRAGAGAIALTLLFAIASVRDFSRFTETGDGLNGIHGQERAPNWRIENVRAVSRAIDELAAPGESVLSLWPGYIFESKAAPFPGLENNTGRDLADGLNPADAARYHILSKDRIDFEITRRNPRIVVIGNQESMFVDADPYLAMVSRAGYTVVRRIGDTSIWLAPR